MLIVGIDVGASFHVAAMASSLEETKDWKKLETLRFDVNKAGFEALKAFVERYTPETDNTHMHMSATHQAVGTTSRARPRTDEYPENIGHCVKVAMEPTGRFYSETIGHYCEAQGWEVYWVENKALHEYRSMMKSPSKSDAMDARLLAHYLAHQHQTTTRPDCDSRVLRHLTQELRGLQKQRLQYRNRLCQLLKVTFPECEIGESKRMLELLAKAPSAKRLTETSLDEIGKTLRHGPRAIKIHECAYDSVGIDDPHYCDRITQAIRVIQAIDTRIEAAEEEIEHRVNVHPDGDIVKSLPGVGTLCAAALIGTYGTVDRFKTKAEFKHKLGVAANDKQSGTSVNSRTMNRRATKYARTALHMATVACLGPSVGENYFKAYFTARRNDDARGHNRRLLGRIRGKMAEVLYALLKRRESYDRKAHKETEERKNHGTPTLSEM